MIVALHQAPRGFFKTGRPHSNGELLRLVQKAASLGFKAMEIGPLADYVVIDGRRLRLALDELKLDRSVHVGGIFDAAKFASVEEEYDRMKAQIRRGVGLCVQIGSALLSVHPPFFVGRSRPTEEVLSAARMRFRGLLEEEISYAHRNKVGVALESFCYHPFIFDGLNDFTRFVSNFKSKELLVLLDVGHLYQMHIDIAAAIHAFRDRLGDVHVHDATFDGDFRKATHLPVGKGAIDFSRLIQLLRGAGYDGWLTLEIRASERGIKESKVRLESVLESR